MVSRAVCLVLSGMVAAVASAAESPDLRAPAVPVPEAELLDVGVVVFDPGLPDSLSERRELERAGIFSEVREAEARFIPVHLARTLQKTGFWGAVRVVPTSGPVDLVITGRIRSSTGEKLDLDVVAVDARGKVWLDGRYKEKAQATRADGDRFQTLYHELANDLAKKRSKLDRKDIREIQQVAALRFASELAPSIFSGYLRHTKKDRFRIERLPARDDPMMARVERLRLRNAMFLDTVDAYYGKFYGQMKETYDRYRRRDYWERRAMKRRRTGAGRSAPPSASGLGAVLPPGPKGPIVEVGAVCGTPQAVAPWARGAASSAQNAVRPVKNDLDVLRELGSSLALDVAPLLIEVEGHVVRLTGSVEAQYARWRKLLREIFEAEVGLPASSS